MQGDSIARRGRATRTDGGVVVLGGLQRPGASQSHVVESGHMHLSITVLWIVSLLILPVAVALVCWGLWGDRSKGRPRCPNCWYDMRGSLHSLACPECGHTVRHKRRLYEDRQRRAPVVVGKLLVILHVVFVAALVLRPILPDLIAFWDRFNYAWRQ